MKSVIVFIAIFLYFVTVVPAVLDWTIFGGDILYKIIERSK